MAKGETPVDTPVPVPMVVQPHGGALQVGGNNGGGRPVEHFRRRCREAFDEAGGLDFLVRVVKGEETDDQIVTIGSGKDAQVAVQPVKPKLRDRILAAQLLVEHGHGKPPQKLEVETAPQATTMEQVEARLLELLPRVLPALPVEKRTLVDWLQRGKAVREVLVSGREIKRAKAGGEK